MDLQKITNLPLHKEVEVESDHEDALSLCDLSSTDHSEYDTFQFDRDSEDSGDNFEFSFNNPFVAKRNNDAVLDLNNNAGVNFCGKIIGNKQESVNRVVENQRRLKKSASSQTSQATGSYRRLYSSSKCNSRKQTALIGLVKIPTEMDLSDIKRRQSKWRNPTTTTKLPVTAVGEPAAIDDDGSGGGSEIEKRRENRWGLARSLRYGTRFANVFSKASFDCFSSSLVRVCH